VTSLLQGIWNTVKAFGELVLWALVSAINLVIAAVGAFIGLVLSLLPGFPAVPDLDQPEAAGWLAWALPVAGIITAFSALVVTYTIFLAIRIALRWVKAL
jgi:hypothetical protein